MNIANSSNTSQTQKLDINIFKAYDIRGIVGENLDEYTSYIIGQAIAKQADAQNQKIICVGFDGRISSPRLAKNLINGIISTGIHVIDIGMVTTPLTYFTTFNTPKELLEQGLECKSSIMITGSHNPPNYNGFKIVIDNKTLYGQDILDLYNICIDESFNKNHNIINGRVFNYDIFPEYKNNIITTVKLHSKLKVAIDCGNGVAGNFAPQILNALGCEVIELFCEVDGNFPNHHPDPAKIENLQDLIKCVKENDCDIGLAFDGDGDRLGVVTKEGNIIYPDRQLILFSLDVLNRNPNAKIVFDVKCTANLAPAIKNAGGEPIMYKTGHSIIKAYMKEQNCLLGGEMSGHIFFKERWFGFDDGIYAAARLLEILSKSENPSQVLNNLPDSYCTPEIQIDCSNMNINQFKIVELFKEYIIENMGKFIDGNINYIDGVRIDYPNGFGLVRASNTTPTVVMRFEGKTQEFLHNIKNLFNEILNNIIKVNS